jgi:sulfate adenylyltransferase
MRCFNASSAENYGCTHFIIGHQHADPGKLTMARHRFMTALRPSHLCRNLPKRWALRVVPFDELVYLPFEDEFCPNDEVAAGTETISLSSLDIRERIRTGRKIPRWATFPEVVGELKKAYPPPSRQGFTVFFTGLSGER